MLIETRVDAWGDEDVTKSEAGMRTIPLAGGLVSELRAWKLRSPHSKDDDLIFPNTEGGHVHHTNFLKREWHPLFEAADLKPFKWHHLRHFAASCWIEAKLQPKTVQTFIGHATLAMTMDLYGHLFKSDDHQDAMDEIAKGILS
jgi:integrase